MRIDKVYTKAGDSGETSLIGGERVPKHSLRIECYGTVDELNAALGLVRTAAEDTATCAVLIAIVNRLQNELFNLGAELATPDDQRRERVPAVHARHIAALEHDIDTLNDGLPALKSFVLPGGGWVSSFLHQARTICRRAERSVVKLAETQIVGPHAIGYLNRLSDALFVFGRWAAVQEGKPEPLWEPEGT